MRIAIINSFNVGSTGIIVRDIAETARSKGHKVFLCYPKSRTNKIKYKKEDILIGNRFSRNIGIFIEEFGGIYIANFFSTLQFIYKLKQINPDIIHLHNLHGSYINIPLFFKYLKKSNKRIIWTFHDCWPFTGHCPHYITVNCDRWKNQCYNCPQYDKYPRTKYDNSRYLYKLKRKIFRSISDLTVVCVSSWLSNQVAASFLSSYPRYVISPGVNLSVFHPNYYNIKDFKINIKQPFIIMGVATSWSANKGLYDYLELSKYLKSDEIIVLVGLENNIILPNNIIKIARTNSREELASLYTKADVLLSLSKAETFGLTIAESMACGTPVIVYNNTAQPEIVDINTGYVVEQGNISELYYSIEKIREKGKLAFSQNCINNVKKKYSVEVNVNKYIDIYENNISD